MMENKDSDSDARDSSSAVSQSNNGIDDTSSDVECPKCKVCKKRLGRRNCLHQACVKCCTSPTCEPHREARSVLKKKESILDGTDWITRTAAKKRSSKVARGVFFDSDIQYFGETVVIWDVNEFMEVPKWREDAMRRSRNRKDGNGHLDLSVSVAGGGKKRRRREEESVAVAVAAGNKEGNGKKKTVSRKKRFKNICDELYQKSLT
mmetsp:Transcript_35472/g.62265  ORF Transcript_35472/g.62265 Transcript_35472/m.62265 type:complete len:206 (-) Transcript_35472:232-849(-)